MLGLWRRYGRTKDSGSSRDVFQMILRVVARNPIRNSISLSLTAKRLNSSLLNESQFHKLSDTYLDAVADYFEGIGEDNFVGKEYDVLLSVCTFILISRQNSLTFYIN
jgi:hypothetical protein